MNLYTDETPKTKLKGLGFKNEDKAIETIYKVEKYILQTFMQPILYLKKMVVVLNILMHILLVDIVIQVWGLKI